MKYFFALLIVAGILKIPWDVYTSNKALGWDHQVYCKAFDNIQAGVDPYLTKNLGSHLSYAYPAVFAEIYSPVCSMGDRGYLVLHLLSLILIFFLMIQVLKTDKFVTSCWLFFGFNTAYSNYRTGNIGIFEALLFTLFLILYYRQKLASVLFLVPASFVKIVPGVMILPALLIEKSNRQRLKLTLIFGLGMLALMGLNYAYAPELFRSYLAQIFGHHSGQHSPVLEVDSNPSNLTVILFFKNLSIQLFGGHHIYLLIALSAALAAFSYWIWKTRIRHESDRLCCLCWSILLLTLWLPRLKPYSLLIPIVALIPILQTKSKKVWISLLFLSVFHRVINGDKNNLLWDLLANNTAIYAYIITIYILARSQSKTALKASSS